MDKFITLIETLLFGVLLIVGSLIPTTESFKSGVFFIFGCFFIIVAFFMSFSENVRLKEKVTYISIILTIISIVVVLI